MNTFMHSLATTLEERTYIMGLSDDMLMMRNGQMLILRDNSLIALSEDMVLVDGTRIAMDGRVIMTDGTFETLVEGQAILVENRAPVS
jgi:uncharacterized Zn-binding protein involved in type VI secretion